MLSAMRDIAGNVKSVVSVAPVSGTSAANGAAVDRTNFMAGLGVIAYAISGAPTGGTITAKFQDSADGSTGWADYGSAVVTPVTGNANVAVEVGTELVGAKQYVRLVITPAMTGGTPALVASGVVQLGGAYKLPA